MQEDLDLNHPNLNIDILSVNKLGATGEGNLSADQDLPMVQDNSTDLIWDTWGGDWRDVVILDGNNEIYAIYNLTMYNLSDSANYDALKQLFIDAAGTL